MNSVTIGELIHLSSLSPINFTYGYTAKAHINILRWDLKTTQIKYKNFIDCSCYIDDFYDTANIIKQLDMVISIDSAVAHLSGALGVKTWVLLIKYADWRWMEDIDYSPWYPTVKLFRQQKNWKEVIKIVKKELSVFL